MGTGILIIQKGGIHMFTYDFSKFFSFKVWMKEQLSKHDVLNMGMNALDDLKDKYRKQFEEELETGILKEI